MVQIDLGFILQAIAHTISPKAAGSLPFQGIARLLPPLRHWSVGAGLFGSLLISKNICKPARTVVSGKEEQLTTDN
jgi:hypothetical protein